MRTIFELARLAALAGAVALAGCVTTDNTLSQTDIGSLKLTGVNVSFAGDAMVRWEEGIRSYATAKGLPDDDIAAASNSPEANAYVRNALGARIKAGVDKAMAGQLNGPRPVRLDVVVHSFVISSAVQRILIGGGHGMSADANLVDARTGAVILAYPNLVTTAIAGQGVLGTAVEAAAEGAAGRTTMDRIVDGYGEAYRDWLLRKPT